MISILYCVISWVLDISLEAILFSLIDFQVKRLLKEASNDDEKRLIWLYEAGVLVVVSIILSILHHTPYILLFLAASIVIYTQLKGRVNFGYWWGWAVTWWEDFHEHQESMEQYNSMQQTRQQISTQPPPNVQIGPTHTQHWMPQTSAFPVDLTPPNEQSDDVRHRRVDTTPHYPAATTNTNPPVYGLRYPVTRTDLTRRPLHRSPPIKNTEGLSTIFKSKVRSALGFIEPLATPPGLANNGNNLCFFNSVLQCIANSPFLVDILNENNKDSLLEEVVNVMAALRSHPGNKQIIETQSLRQLLSELPNSLLSIPYQHQQDAAEFLMWFLSTLHTSCQKTDTPQGGQPRYTNMSVNMLKFIYADLTPQKKEELKMECKKQIEHANGLDNDSYAEAIQRLSDLEWLSYKERNHSVVDDLFTGQLVEAQHCLTCNRVSIGIQTFSILPLPVGKPRQLNRLVYLEDCFTKFGKIEDLFGLDGLHCVNCSKKETPQMANGKKFSRLVSDAMSPIPLVAGASGEAFNDSGFHDNHVRTSTPIHGSNVVNRLTDGQRRSLLRQLPECLCVQLLRFTVDEGCARKVLSPVSIPLSHLDLTHLLIDHVIQRQQTTAPFRYNLYAVCLHLGADSTACGHYVAYIKAVDNCWYRCDDSNIQPVNMEYELSTKQVRENAYLLFYKKVV